MRSFGVSKATGRRSVPRAQAPLTAVLSVSTGEHRVELLDVSRTGARLRGDFMPDCTQPVVFRAEKVQVAAEVAWADDESCAIEFDTPISVSEVQRLQYLGKWALKRQ